MRSVALDLSRWRRLSDLPLITKFGVAVIEVAALHSVRDDTRYIRHHGVRDSAKLADIAVRGAWAKAGRSLRALKAGGGQSGMH